MAKAAGADGGGRPVSAPQLFRFHGGVELDSRKTMATARPIQVAPIPPRLVLPLNQHVGAPAEALVSAGDRVLRGQPIARPTGYVGAGVHASSSGRVVAVADHVVPHPSGLSAPCVIIETDGEDQPWDGYDPLTNYRTLNGPALRARVREAGLVGLGGAAFPTAVKLSAGSGIRTLILNGAECEPYICCDDMLLRERAVEVVAGAQALLHALEIERCVIAIEDDKPEALSALKAALERESDRRLRVVTVPSRYPEGGEKQLIQVLTGEEVPASGVPPDIGYLVHNVGTAAAVARAVLDGEPLISRIVTVTGHGIERPGNLEVRLGTPVADVIESCGGYTGGARHLIQGGAMMGFPLASDAVPVVKATNCLLVATEDDIRPREPAWPCIRCGECAVACPANLLPQQLYWHTRAESFDDAAEFGLFDCIECGCCDVVCPSQIPLTGFFRYAKAEIFARERDRASSDIARDRFEARKNRLEAEAAAKQARTEARKAALKQAGASESTRKAMIDEVVARAKARKGGTTGEKDSG
jgi:electron transport complex protein RnfC